MWGLGQDGSADGVDGVLRGNGERRERREPNDTEPGQAKKTLGSLTYHESSPFWC